MAIITLTTDFGIKDHFVATVKGRILSEAANVQIVDISHGISPFDVQECAYILQCAYAAFPEGTIHIIGLESEWSPENEHLLARIDGHFFIGANNGVLSILAAKGQLQGIWQIAGSDKTTSSFPESEVFAKIAAILANGGTPEEIGAPFPALKEIKEIEPIVSNNGATLIGNVIYIDHYGNVVTNIGKALFELHQNDRAFEIVARRHTLNTVYNTYTQLIDFDLPKNQRKGASDFLALFNSSGYLELAIFKSDLRTVGGASSLLGLKNQDRVTINFF